ncbi:MAG: SMC family ATPase [Spirochaetia bacterium]|jgi:DNA repair exonuclease SbcCD ATPase subunit|nr:SMC family ATPase [Spirochaetia bacterium]
MLHNLKLENYKTHKSLSVDFAQGMTAITGDNGRGKSNLLKAILYALFGAQGAGLDKSNLSNWEADSHEVKLTVDLPGYPQCTIVRTPKSSKILDANGQLLASGISAVTAFVEEALGISYKDFHLMAYSKQGDAQALLAMGAAGLQRRVEDLAKIDLIDKVLTLVSKDVSFVEGQIAGIGEIPDVTVLAARRDQLKAELEQKETDLEVETEALARFRAALEQAETDYQAALRKHNQIDSVIRNLQQHKTWVDQTRETLLKLDTELAQLPDASVLRVDLQELDLQYSETQTQILATNSHLRERAQIEKALEAQEAFLEGARAEIQESAAAEQKLQEVTPRVDALYQRMVGLESQAAAATQRASEARKAVRDSVCQSCNRPFSEDEKTKAEALLVETEQRKDEAVQVAEYAAQEYHRARAEKARLVKLYKPNLAAQVEAAQEAVEALRKELKPISEADVLQTQLSQLSAKSDELQQVGQNKRTLLSRITSQEAKRESEEATLTRYLEAIQRYKDQLAELGTAPDLDGLLKAVTDWRALKDQSEAAAMRLSGEVRATQQELDNVTRSIEAAKTAAAQLDELRKKQHTLGQLDRFLRKNRARWSAEVWEGLLNYSNYLLNNTTNGLIKDITRTSNGDFYVTYNDRQIPVSELSGGEASITGQWLRVALARVFYGSGLPMLLDEPSADLTDENAARVAGMLQGLGVQVVMVSHRMGDAVNAGSVVTLS